MYLCGIPYLHLPRLYRDAPRKTPTGVIACYGLHIKCDSIVECADVCSRGWNERLRYLCGGLPCLYSWYLHTLNRSVP